MNHERVLKLALCHGQQIFGADFPPERAEGLRWLTRSASRGCSLSQRLLLSPEGQMHGGTQRSAPSPRTLACGTPGK